MQVDIDGKAQVFKTYWFVVVVVVWEKNVGFFRYITKILLLIYIYTMIGPKERFCGFYLRIGKRLMFRSPVLIFVPKSKLR